MRPSKLSEAQFAEIREMSKQGMSYRQIARLFGITNPYVCDIVNNFQNREKRAAKRREAKAQRLLNGGVPKEAVKLLVPKLSDDEKPERIRESKRQYQRRQRRHRNKMAQYTEAVAIAFGMQPPPRRKLLTPEERLARRQEYERQRNAAKRAERKKEAAWLKSVSSQREPKKVETEEERMAKWEPLIPVIIAGMVARGEIDVPL